MVATQTQLRRGTSTQCNAMTPVEGEVIVDLTNDRLRVGDGSVLGGIHIPNNRDIMSQAFSYWATGGTGNAITITPSPPLISYTTGTSFDVMASANNTGATTFNVNGLGAGTVQKVVSGALTGLEAGDIVSGNIYTLKRNGSVWQLMNPSKVVDVSGLVFLDSASVAGDVIEFQSLIDSTYDDYLLKFNNITVAAAVNLVAQYSTNNGSSYLSTGYVNHTLSSVSLTLTSGSFLGQGSPVINGELKMMGMNNTDASKTFIYNGNGGNSAGAMTKTPAAYSTNSSTSAFNAVRIVSATGSSISTGTASLYGYRK